MCALELSSSGALSVSVSDQGTAVQIERVGRSDGAKIYATDALIAGQRGTGLALTLVQRFIQLHGGFLNVSSSGSERTTVTVTFPANRLRNS